MADSINQKLQAYQELKGENIESIDEALPFFKTVCPFLDKIDPKYAEAVFWVDWQGMPQKDFAEKLGISVSGAKSRVQRGREHIKSLFNQCCQFEYDSRGQVMDYKKRPNSPCENCCFGYDGQVNFD